MSKLKNTECNNSNPECCLCEYCELIVVNRIKDEENKLSSFLDNSDYSIEFKFQFKDVLEKYKNSL